MNKHDEKPTTQKGGVPANTDHATKPMANDKKDGTNSDHKGKVEDKENAPDSTRTTRSTAKDLPLRKETK